MALTIAHLVTFSHILVNLPSFPLFCAYIGMIILAPFWQKNTSPWQLRPILVIHNFLCSALSVFTLIGFSASLYKSDSSFSRTTTSQIQYFYWLYWVSKNLELLDTVFMIVRHKRRQISFLHVYHHSTMLLLSDIAYHQYPWIAISTYLGLNSLVHVVLYFYYGMTALFPNNPPQWKRGLTQLQIIQFLIGFCHASIGYMYHGFCIYGLFYDLSMTVLFSNFYYRAYIKRPVPTKKLD